MNHAIHGPTRSDPQWIFDQSDHHVALLHVSSNQLAQCSVNPRLTTLDREQLSREFTPFLKSLSFLTQTMGEQKSFLDAPLELVLDLPTFPAVQGSSGVQLICLHRGSRAVVLLTSAATLNERSLFWLRLYEAELNEINL